MRRTTRKLSARMRDCIIYKLSLTGEVKAPGWQMRVERELLMEAIDAAMQARPVAGTGRRGSAAVVLTVCEGGLSLRCSGGATDIEARGIWASPIKADGLMVLRVLGRLTGDCVDLTFRDRRLGLNERSVRAREI